MRPVARDTLDAAADGLARSRPRCARPACRSCAHERAVDVEREHPDRELGRRADGGAVVRDHGDRSAAALPRARAAPGRAAVHAREPGQPRQVRLHERSASPGRCRRDRLGRPPRPGRRRSRAARPRRRPSASGSRSSSRRIDVQAVGPAVERRPRLERELARQPVDLRRSRRTAGSRRSAAYGGSHDRRQQVRLDEHASGPRPHGPTAFSRARSSAAAETSIAITSTCSAIRRVRSAASSASGDRPRARPDVGDAQGGAPAGRGAAVEPRRHLGHAPRPRGAPSRGAGSAPARRWRWPGRGTRGSRGCRRRARRARGARRQPRTAPARRSPTGASGWAMTPMRSTPRTCARSSSASRRGRAGARGASGGRRQLADERPDDGARGVGHGASSTDSVSACRRSAWSAITSASMSGSSWPSSTAGHVVDREADAVVGHPVVGEVVGPDLLGPVAAADHRPAARRSAPRAAWPARRSYRRERRTDIAFALFLCWLFSSWISTTRPDGRCVIRTAESVVLTDWPPGPGAALDLDPEVPLLVDLHLDLVHLGQDDDGGGARVDAAAATPSTGTRWTRWTPPSNLSRLYAPSPATSRIASLMPPMPVSLRLMRSVCEPVLLRVARVHAQQLGREQRRLLAAGAGPDLDDDVAVVVGVAREQRDLEVLDAAASRGPRAPRSPRGPSPSSPRPSRRRASGGRRRAARAPRPAPGRRRRPARGGTSSRPSLRSCVGVGEHLGRAELARRPRRTGAARSASLVSRLVVGHGVVRVGRQPAIGGSMAGGRGGLDRAPSRARRRRRAPRRPGRLRRGLAGRGHRVAGEVQAALGDGLAVGPERLLHGHDRDLDHVVGRLLGRDHLDQDPGPHDHA